MASPPGLVLVRCSDKTTALLVRMAGRTPSKRKMSSAPSVSVSNNNIVECSQEMAGIIKRILVKLCL